MHRRATLQSYRSTKQFPRDILASTSLALTRHKEIGRVGRVGLGCYGNASDLSVTSRACRARAEFVERHDKRAALYPACSRPPADQSGKRVASCPSTRPTSSRGSS